MKNKMLTNVISVISSAYKKFYLKVINCLPTLSYQE